MSKSEAKKLAETVTISDLRLMFVNAFNTITKWDEPSRINKGMSKGAAYNILGKSGFDGMMHKIAKVNMIREFGEYLPTYKKKEPVKRKKITIMETHCKSCHHIIDAHTSIGDDAIPNEGDLSICFYCGVVSTFDADLNLIPMTEEELSTLRVIDYDNWLNIQKAALYIQQHIKKN